MSKKLDFIGSKPVLEYTVVETPNLRNGKTTKVPRLIEQETVSLREVLERASGYGYILGQPTLFLHQFETMMSIVMGFLEEGKAVNLGGYLRIQPHLKGNVNETGLVTRSNKLAVRVTALARLKMSLQSFAWRLRGDRAREL